jgi:hypothetical protein
MSYISNHTKDCERFIGRGYEEVHMFLDQYAGIFNPIFFDDYHRTFLHNSYGMQIVKEVWGNAGYNAAMLHLTRDYVNGTIDHWTVEGMLKEFPKRLMWFDKMHTNYVVKPHVVRQWNNISLVAMSTI